MRLNIDLRSLLTGVGVTVLLGLLVFVLLVWSGAYDVAASHGHSSLERMVLSSTMKRSVKVRAGGTPPTFTAAMLRSGGAEYKGMCEHCHGGPGVSRAEWAKGMTPLPPDLTKEAAEWTPEQLHWIVEHGVKMSGMPAFGGTHDSQTTWNIAGFVKQLPKMSPEAYAAIPSEDEGGGHHGS